MADVSMWNVWASAISLVLYIVLCRQIWTGKLPQNIATWVLWVLLDMIALGSVWCQNGNWIILLVYVAGGTAISICIVKSKNFKWTWVETGTAFLVVVCMIIWAYSGHRNATIASSIAVFIAGMPQLVDILRKPWESPFLIWIGFTASNAFSALAGKEWSIEERFYGSTVTILTTLYVLGTVRKLWVKAPEG